MMMMTRVIPMVVAATVIAACQQAPAVPDAQAKPAHGDSTHAPVVVELYQSQGCSSCPPAQSALNAIADQPGVIALSFAVTYWDRLGWTDIFGQEAFTRRQHAYAAAQNSGRVYTPQVIINGERRLVGNRPGELAKALSEAKSVAQAVTVAVDGQAITLSGLAAKDAGENAVWLVRYDPRTVNVAIGSGENVGRTLAHRNIVTGIDRIATYRGGTVRIVLPATGRPGIKRALLIQRGDAGPIIAARAL